jgi:hypothetical protein
MKRNGHHLRCAFTAFFVQGIESAFDVIVKIGRRTKAGWDVEFIVVAIWGLLVSVKGFTGWGGG